MAIHTGFGTSTGIQTEISKLHTVHSLFCEYAMEVYTWTPLL